jgi:ABC-type multidrug transport system fused ATPase/permease subunit
MKKTTAIKEDSDAVKIENLPVPNMKATAEDLDSIQVLTPRTNASRNFKLSIFGTIISAIVLTVTSLAYPFLWSIAPPAISTNQIMKIVGQIIFFAVIMFVVLFTSTSLRTWISSRSS